MKKLLLSILSVLALSTAFSQDLPNTAIKDMNGSQLNFNETHQAGKVTVYSFWATWCVPCKKELNTVSELYEDWTKKYNVKMIAVSIDDSRNSSKVKPYVDAQRWDFGVFLDINQDFKRALNIQSVPFTVLIDQTGKIVYTHSGYVEGDETILEEEIAKLSK